MLKYNEQYLENLKEEEEGDDYWEFGMNSQGEWRRRHFVNGRMVGASPDSYLSRGEYIKDAIRRDLYGK